MKAITYVSLAICWIFFAAMLALGVNLWQSQASYSQMAQAYSSCSYQLNVSRPYKMRGKKAPGFLVAK